MKHPLVIASHEIGHVWRVTDATDDRGRVVGPLAGLMDPLPATGDLERLLVDMPPEARVALLFNRIPSDAWIVEACSRVAASGRQLATVVGRDPLARELGAEVEHWLVSTGPGLQASAFGSPNAADITLLSWDGSAKELYERFADHARDRKGRDLGQLKVSRGRLFAAVHEALTCSDRGASARAVGADGHGVEYSSSDLDECLGPFRRSAVLRLREAARTNPAMAITDDAAAWLGAEIAGLGSHPIITLRGQYDRLRVLLASTPPAEGSVLVCDRAVSRPRSLEWRRSAETPAAGPRAGWPLSAFIAVVLLALVCAGLAASTAWYRSLWLEADARLDRSVSRKPGPIEGFVRITALDITPEGRGRLMSAMPFSAGLTEVTVGEFRKFVEATGHTTGAERSQAQGNWRSIESDDRPVVWITPDDATKYVEWLSRSLGRTFSVPDATQWELAARSGSTARYAFGSELKANQAIMKPKPLSSAKSGEANPAGLYGVHGNASELARRSDGTWVKLGGDHRGSATDLQFLDPAKAPLADQTIGDASTGFRVIMLEDRPS